jgi:mannose-1-phosphate guanylyltransferase
MLQETVLRVADPKLFTPVRIVSGKVFAEETARHIGELGLPGRLILEPLSRGTAPAVALAALDLLEAGLGEVVMLVLPADHLIQDHRAFLQAVETACRTGPLRPFGHSRDPAHLADDGLRLHPPRGSDADAGRLGLSDRQLQGKAGRRHRNGVPTYRRIFLERGIFLFRAADLLAELARLCPEVLAACRKALLAGKADANVILADETHFASCPSGSLDVLVMEKTERGAVVAAPIGWSDVGSWEALWQVSDKDADGNVLVGDVVTIDARDCYGRAEGSATLALIGLEGVVAVAAGSTILVARRDAAEQVKGIYERLKKRSAQVVE